MNVKLTSAGWEGLSDGGAGVGESAGIPVVARLGDALENKVHASGHEEGGVVWRRDVLRGTKHGASPPAPHSLKRPSFPFSMHLSQISTEGLVSFAVFQKCFCKNSFSSLPTYKDAIFQIVEVTNQNIFHISLFFEPE